MLAHLEVAIHALPEADALGDLERRVLGALGPPLTSTVCRPRLYAPAWRGCGVI
jgi:hypothetical protein